MVPLEMPNAVALSQWMGVGGCGWPSSANVSIIVRPSYKFMKSAPKYASADDDTTHFNIVKRVNIEPLSVMGYPYLGTEPREKWPDAQLLAFFADR